ncbi:MAG: outer membrane beta-barrel protein [Steroidobacteraceae bacterium]
MRASHLAAALSLCLTIPTAVYAQSVVNSVTTGAANPEVEPLLTPTTPTERSQTVTVGVTLGMGETDNVGETSDKRSQTLALAGLDFGWIRTGSALEANVAGNFNYVEYVEGAYSAQLLARFDGTTSLSLFDDHLKWYLQDDFGEGQLNPFLSATPTNLEQVNVVTTGPEVTLRPLSDTVLQLGARYSQTSYQTSPLDGSRAAENLLLEHLLSGNSNVGLGAELEQLKFDDKSVNEDYDRSRFYLRYELGGAHTHITTLVGETQSNDGGSWAATPFVKIDLAHDLSQRTSLAVTAGRELTDASDAFTDVRGGAAGGIAVAAAPLTTADYLRNYISAGLQATGRQTTIGATAYWERDTYAVDNTFNVTRGIIELRAGRQLSAAISADIFTTIMRSQYFTQDADINTYAVGADIKWQASRTLSVAGRYFHNTQSTPGTDFGYSSNLIFVTVTYRPLLSDQTQQLFPSQQQ